MQRTRRQIVDFLKRKGPASLDELARETELSPVTVRTHVSVLEREALIGSQEVRGRIGRPFFVYSLTEQAEKLFPAAYHGLTNAILDEIVAWDGQSKLAGLFDRIADKQAAEDLKHVAGKDIEARVAEVARLRTAEGALAEWEKIADSYWLHQYHCPTLRVAGKHPSLCQSELKYLNTLLAVDVQRTHCLTNGDRTCSYMISDQPSAASHQPEGRHQPSDV